MNLENLMDAEIQRRERRNEKDKITRKFLRENPKVKDNPDMDLSEIPEGTTECHIRSMARYNKKRKLIRELVNARS
jgi:hypothetical protein